MATPLPTSLRLGNELRAALRKAAEDDNRSMNNLIEKILSDWLKDRGYLPK